MVKISKVIGLYKPIHHCRGDHLQIFRFDLPEIGPSRFFVNHGLLVKPWSISEGGHHHCKLSPKNFSVNFLTLTGWWFGPFFIFPNSWDDDII